MDNKRLPEITKIGTVYQILGIILFFLGLIGLTFAILSEDISAFKWNKNLSDFQYYFIYVLGLLLCASMFVLGRGLLKLKEWARIGTMTFLLVVGIAGSLIYFCLNWSSLSTKGILYVIAMCVFAFRYIGYLRQPEVKEQFDNPDIVVESVKISKTTNTITNIIAIIIWVSLIVFIAFRIGNL